MLLEVFVFVLRCMIWQFKPEEITAIMNDFNEPGSLAPTGLYLGGTKYMVIQGEPNAVIRGKKVLLLADIMFSLDIHKIYLLNELLSDGRHKNIIICTSNAVIELASL